MPPLARNVPTTSQYLRGTNARIFSSRSVRIARVGVCTRPTVVRWKPPDFELNAVIARVPLMPTSQSDSERQTAASASGRIAASGRSAPNASRIAAVVIDCSHSRSTGFADFAYWTMLRKMSSPSRPASHALTSFVTSLRRISFRSTLRRLAFFSIGFSANFDGMAGRCAKVHLPRFTSSSSGMPISSRWPTAEESTCRSLSK